MILVVIGVLVWNLSNQLKMPADILTFSEFITAVENKQVATVTITGQEVAGTFKTDAGKGFRLIVPAQYENLVNKLIENQVVVTAKQASASPWTALLYNWAPILLMIG